MAKTTITRGLNGYKQETVLASLFGVRLLHIYEITNTEKGLVAASKYQVIDSTTSETLFESWDIDLAVIEYENVIDSL